VVKQFSRFAFRRSLNKGPGATFRDEVAENGVSASSWADGLVFTRMVGCKGGRDAVESVLHRLRVLKNSWPTWGTICRAIG
jgi:hypothetical protein